MAHLHLNELSLICDMWLNKITYLLYGRFKHVTCTLYSNKVCDWLEKQ